MTNAAYAAIFAGQFVPPAVQIYAQMDPTLPNGLSRLGEGTLIGQMVLMVVTLSGFAYTIYREKQKQIADDAREERKRQDEVRNRQWDLEDRERASKELADKVEAQQRLLAMKVEEQKRHTDAHMQSITERGQTILKKIDENTAVNETAISTANQHNEKIIELSRMFTEVQKDVRGTANAVVSAMVEAVDQVETLHRVDENTQETVDRLRQS